MRLVIMGRFFSFIFSVVLLNVCHVESRITIPIYRQRTPRENVLLMPNIEEHGIWLDWLKPHHHAVRTNDTIPLLRYLDTEFYGEINVGHPGQKMNVVFDTAWSSSWVLSKDCPSKVVGCWFHNRFDHNHSSTFSAINKTFNVNEGSYNLTGYYANDSISFAHSRVKQTFIEMTNVPYWYIFSKSDGIIGLGLKYGSDNPFFYNLMQQTNITKPIFCIYLNRDESSKKGGSIILGDLEEKHIHHTPNNKPENITYVPINTETGLWEFNMNKVFLQDGTKVYPICDTNCKGLADTSSNSIITSKEYLERLNKLIGARPFMLGKFEMDCATINKLPFINFVIAGNNFTLSGKEYVQKISMGPITVCLSAFTAASAVSEQNRWIMGGAFLAKFYSIYDLGNKRMGFVRAATA